MGYSKVISKLPLYPLPSLSWLKKYKLLIQNPYIKHKYNRHKRLMDKIDYINQYASEIKTMSGKVLDIGPGPGEFLEVCRFLGHPIVGIDALPEDCEMGDEYLQLSQLLTQRQKIKVIYQGFENLLSSGTVPFANESFCFINSQGSIEQIFKSYLSGLSHKYSKNAHLLTWEINPNTINMFRLFFTEIQRLLTPAGIFLVYGNGATNSRDYDRLVRMVINETQNLKLFYTQSGVLHKGIKL